MTNLLSFYIKRVAWKVTAKGYKRSFRVVTADGKEYTTTRRDSLHSAYQWGGSYGIELRTIEAIDLIECGIKGGIYVDQGDVSKPISVQPITVEQVGVEEIELSKELELFYFIWKPKKPSEYVPDTMKCEEII